jgi:hypothetical protein
MPGIDQSGPMGQGPMTGRRMGRCTNFGANLKKKATAPDENAEENLPIDFPGRGLGYGRGRGGRGHGKRWQ